MLKIRQEKAADAAAREALLDSAYGPSRFAKPSARLREGRPPARGLSWIAVEADRLVGTVRLWEIEAGAGRPALLLGPLAVDPDHRGRGIGSALMQRALAAARRRGHRAVVLVGDASYYGRFGFSADKTTALWMPGLHDQHRLLGCELQPGALADVRGIIRAPHRTTVPMSGRIAATVATHRPIVPRAA